MSIIDTNVWYLSLQVYTQSVIQSTSAYLLEIAFAEDSTYPSQLRHNVHHANFEIFLSLCS